MASKRLPALPWQRVSAGNFNVKTHQNTLTKQRNTEIKTQDMAENIHFHDAITKPYLHSVYPANLHADTAAFWEFDREVWICSIPGSHLAQC